MNKYVVLQKIAQYNANEVRSFDNLTDAQMYCKLMKRSEKNKFTTFFVAKVIEDDNEEA